MNIDTSIFPDASVEILAIFIALFAGTVAGIVFFAKKFGSKEENHKS